MEPVAQEFSDLFNSRLETGIRSVVILESLRPLHADITEMVLFDHVVVHSADLGGPRSLHAQIPERRGELLVRRRLVAAGLELMRRCHLLEKATDERGFIWSAADDAASYVELLETPYSLHLKHCATWLASEIRKRTKPGFNAFARQELGDWTDSFYRGA